VLAEGARRAAEKLQRYEYAALSVEDVRQGDESAAFWAYLPGGPGTSLLFSLLFINLLIFLFIKFIHIFIHFISFHSFTIIHSFSSLI
jgi:hypothetical protein